MIFKMFCSTIKMLTAILYNIEAMFFDYSRTRNKIAILKQIVTGMRLEYSFKFRRQTSFGYMGSIIYIKVLIIQLNSLIIGGS